MVVAVRGQDRDAAKRLDTRKQFATREIRVTIVAVFILVERWPNSESRSSSESWAQPSSEALNTPARFSLVSPIHFEQARAETDLV
jgi:hypothetical protein